MTPQILATAASLCCTALLLAQLSGAYWAPTNDVELAYQLGTSFVQKPGVMLYSLDGFDTSAATISSMHAQGLRAMCYLSAGSWESWRPDAGDFPQYLIGNPLAGWAGEKWFDVSNPALRPFMTLRVQMCAAKGFDAVDWDNVNAWSNSNTGFNVTSDEQVAFNSWLASETHKYNMSVALKNDQMHASQLVNDFDLAVNEECFTYQECGPYSDFVSLAKPVYVIQYEEMSEADFLSQVCPAAASLGVHAARYHLSLDAYRLACQYNGTGFPQLSETGGHQVPTNVTFYTVNTRTLVMAGKRLDGSTDPLF